MHPEKSHDNNLESDKGDGIKLDGDVDSMVDASSEASYEASDYGEYRAQRETTSPSCISATWLSLRVDENEFGIPNRVLYRSYEAKARSEKLERKTIECVSAWHENDRHSIRNRGLALAGELAKLEARRFMNEHNIKKMDAVLESLASEEKDALKRIDTLTALCKPLREQADAIEGENRRKERELADLEKKIAELKIAHETPNNDTEGILPLSQKYVRRRLEQFSKGRHTQPVTLHMIKKANATIQAINLQNQEIMNKICGISKENTPTQS